ncbi:MAG: hypothetical protein E7643_04530 [Ruminococcaceae bacterium]|nr:hypothetical protein [Oscillospiraceae bacterium]
MKMFAYYAFCTVKNQIRKLFKTWVAVLLVICFAFGLIFGMGASFLENAFSDEEGYEEEVYEEEEFYEEEPLTEEELRDVYSVIELVAGGIVLLLLVFHVFGADKSGNAIFLPADIPILFASPMKPQAVLTFRLVTQAGSFLFVGLYMLLQLPTFLSSGVPVGGTFGMIGALILLLIIAKLIQVLLYTVASTHTRIKAYLRPVTLGLLVLIAAAAALYAYVSGEEPMDAMISFFNAPVTRFIPVWGWLKGLCMYTLEGNLVGALLSLGALLITAAALCAVIPRLHADFYEDAMAKSEETAALLDAAQNASSGVTVVRQNKKDRSEKLQRDGLRHGAGASVYFFKAMYNRFRFAHLRVFTKTSETYLALALCVSLILRFVFHSSDVLPVALILSALVFFRSLGNPLSTDTSTDAFLLIPENAWKKTFFSLMGGTLNCFLDLIPAYIAVCLILGVNPLIALLWILFAVTLDFYSTNAGVFIDLSIPTVTGKNIKAVIQICFVYFGLIPDAVILLIGALFSPALIPAAAFLASVVNLAIGAIFFAFSPMFLEYGRK